MTIISVAALKISSIFEGKFRENFGLKDWIFPKFCHNIHNFGKNCNFKILKKMKISKSKVYVISQLIFLGGREIRKEAKYCRKFGQNFRQNFGKMFRVQNFTKTATLKMGNIIPPHLAYMFEVINLRNCFAKRLV